MKEYFNNLKKLKKYAAGQKKHFIIILIGSFISVILRIIMPLLSAKIIISLTSNDYLQIILIAISILGVELLANYNSYLTWKNSNIFYQSVLSKLQLDLGKNILKIENKVLEEKGSGIFIQRLTGDARQITTGFDRIFLMASQIMGFIGVLIAIFIVNKIVCLFVIIVVLANYKLEKVRTTRRNKEDKECRKLDEKVSGFIAELVRGTRDIKMLNCEKDFIKELKDKIELANTKKMTMQNTSWAYKLIISESLSFFSFLLIVLLVVLLSRGLIIPAIALVLHDYAQRVSYSAIMIGDFLEDIKDFNLSCERVYSVIENNEFEKEEFGKTHKKRVNGNFEFKNVTFAYKEKNVLNNLNFKINSKETVAFVGKSGSGKTTIFNLLCKMYNVKEGSITIDDIDITKLDKDTIRGNITIISQNPYIFNMSIKDNLKLVKSNLTNEEMVKACKAACLDEYINELPNKYDTIIGEGGINLSGGQKQRLAIARALVQKTEIILFDEATSALDNETQRKIQKAIENMKKKYTILIIAHRLSTILNADRILYLEKGKIEAEGTHQELLVKCKKYKKLYETEIDKIKE